MNDKNDKVSKIQSAREKLSFQLEQLYRDGVELFVDDRAVLPGEAVAKTVQEDSSYMADYVLGEAGNIEQVRFDRVTCR